MTHKIKRSEDEYSVETKLISGEFYNPHWEYAHHVVPPISSSTTFKLESAQRGAQGFVEFLQSEKLDPMHAPIYIYDRLGEPNKDLLEDALCDAEKGKTAVTFTSGMAAISAVLGVLCQAGDEIISHGMVYGCTYSLFVNWYPRLNIGVQFADLTDPNILPKIVSKATRVIYFESPVNPNLSLIDIRAISDRVREINAGRPDREQINVVIDNTFATPFCQRPLELGADFVVHSLTKNISGFGTDMGGAVVTSKENYLDILDLYRKDFGGVLSAKSAWPILVFGLPTLSLRSRAQAISAMRVAKFLSQHPKVNYVNYPGLESFRFHELARKQMVDLDGNFAPGNMIYFSVKHDDPEGRRQMGERFMNHVAQKAYTMTLAVSLGQIRTLVEHPGSMTHSSIPAVEQVERGIDPGGIRMSVGLENIEDLLRELSQTFEAI